VAKALVLHPWRSAYSPSNSNQMPRASC